MCAGPVSFAITKELSFIKEDNCPADDYCLEKVNANGCPQFCLPVCSKGFKICNGTIILRSKLISQDKLHF